MKSNRISLALKALRELGPHKLGLFVLYKAGLKTGYYRWTGGDRKSFDISYDGLETGSQRAPCPVVRPLLNLPDPDVILNMIGSDGISQLKAEADEIAGGRARLFGGGAVALNLAPPGELTHWTQFEQGDRGDIKFVWEPARFGWAFTLGRAYHLTGEERYSEAFWRFFEIFQQANPVNQGPNWESAQEVALRLIAYAFASQIFTGSIYATPERQSQILTAIASHAARIPATLIYARSQNNNHLLSEAAGLISASLALPDHPDAKRWSKLGWQWFTYGLETQIEQDGAYMQQSTNYHRLMLQLALWVFQLHLAGSGNEGNDQGCNLEAIIPKLQLATEWLLSLADPESGRVPNLGPNDGAYILPLTVQPYHDYRAVLQAASRVFLGRVTFEPGAWDEMGVWLSAAGQSLETDRDRQPAAQHQRSHPGPSILRGRHSWAYLRTARFRDRPGHADQLHLDLWWRGLNVAQDAGTYLYNADPPWDNALTHSAVHNTVMVDNQQQMTPAGRFLFLDRAQAEILEGEPVEDGSWKRIVATHDGYKRLGMIHIRSVYRDKDERWLIEDQIQPLDEGGRRDAHSVRLQWLLPDWEWKVNQESLTVEVRSPYGWVGLHVTVESKSLTCKAQPSIIRGGVLLHGRGDHQPSWGWVSPTYGVKQPALSFVVTVTSEMPVSITSAWRFPDD